MSSATWLQPPAQATLDATRGSKPFLSSLFSAHFMQVFLLGMITAKAVTYFSRGSRDHTIVRVCVAFSVFILWCKAGLNTKILWDLVRRARKIHSSRHGADFCLRFLVAFFYAFFLPYRHRRPDLSWSALTLIIISQIQMYVCHRLWAISKKNPVPKIFAVAGTLCSTTLYIIFVTLRIKYRMPEGSQTPGLAWIPRWAFCNCITDIYLSLACTFYLLRTRKKVAGDQLNYMLLRLASLSITTCLPPALISAIMAIVEITKATGGVWTFFKVILASTYVLCIIHSLNSRQEILEEARSRSTMRNPSPLTPGPRGPLELALAGQTLTDSTAMMITPPHTLNSKTHSFSLSTRILGALTAPKRPSMNPGGELEESAFSAVRSENYFPPSRPLQDTQLKKSQDGS